MVFASIPFLYYFLPITLILCAFAPMKFKNALLLVSALFFYWWGEPRYLYLMLAVIASSYGFALLMERFRAARRVFLFASLAVAVGTLLYYKYAAFLITSVNDAFHASLPVPEPALPIGISFYTFQLISYAVDVYRGRVKAQPSPLRFTVYVSMFPQLIAGPIVRYSEVEGALKERRTTWEDMACGLERFVIGLSKKVLVADRLGALADALAHSGEATVLSCWLGAAAFTLQLYFDFSGYSDMAIGLGRVLGFRFPENFRYPLTAQSVTDFWRRWHMTLTGWFRDYVYIPLGGSRCGRARQVRNILLVWTLTGLWHGAAWNFLLWGLYNALFLLFEKMAAVRLRDRIPSPLRHLYLLLVVTAGFVLFNSTTPGGAAQTLGAMFGAASLPLYGQLTLYHLRGNLVLLLMAAVGATGLPRRAAAWCAKRRIGAALRPVVLLMLLMACTAYLVDGSFSPFLYFRF